MAAPLFFNKVQRQKGESAMTKEHTFTTKNNPINDLLELDLEEHMKQMGKDGWVLVSTQQLIGEKNPTIPKMILFWSRGE